MISTKKNKPEDLDLISALSLMLFILKGPHSSLRIQTLNFCLNFLRGKSIFKDTQ